MVINIIKISPLSSLAQNSPLLFSQKQNLLQRLCQAELEFSLGNQERLVLSNFEERKAFQMLMSLSRTQDSLCSRGQIKYISSISFPWCIAMFLVFLVITAVKYYKGRNPPDGITPNLEFSTTPKSHSEWKSTDTRQLFGCQVFTFSLVFSMSLTLPVSDCWTASCCHKHYIGNLRGKTLLWREHRSSGKTQLLVLLLSLLLILLMQI